MLCEICKKEIVKRHTIHSLFKVEKHHICEFCFNKYPLMMKTSVIPIEKGQILWTSMIKTKDTISPIAHMSFMKPFYISFMRRSDKCIFLHFDQLKHKILTILDSLELGDIYLLTLHENIEIEENEYDI